MGKIIDIRPIKKNLREKYRGIRKNLTQEEKEKCDKQIYDKLINLDAYLKADTILIFVSTSLEIDTINIIKKAFEDKKTVAVPKCLDLKGSMDFFIINSLDELKSDSYGLLEPEISENNRLVDYNNSICLVPGFAFDKNGYRIGFGKGYYDRFLSKYTGIKIGICYNSCITNSLPTSKYDVKVDYIVTQKYIITVK